MDLRNYEDEKVRLFAAHITGEEEGGPLSAERTAMILELLDDNELRVKYTRWETTGKTEGNNRKEDVLAAKSAPKPQDYYNRPGKLTASITKAKKEIDNSDLQSKVADRLDTIKARNESIVRDYKSGAENATTLGEKHGLSRERICQILRPHGVIEDRHAARIAAQIERYEARLQKKRDKIAKMEKMKAMVNEGYSIAEAGARVGLNRGSANHAAHKHGMKGLSQHGRWRDWSDRKKKIIELRHAGYSWNEISLELNRLGAIYPWARRHMPEMFSQEELEKNADARRGRIENNEVTARGLDIHKHRPPGAQLLPVADRQVGIKNNKPLVLTRPDGTSEDDPLPPRDDYFITLRDEGFTSSEIAMMASKKYGAEITRNTVLGALYRHDQKSKS